MTFSQEKSKMQNSTQNFCTRKGKQLTHAHLCIYHLLIFAKRNSGKINQKPNKNKRGESTQWRT